MDRRTRDLIEKIHVLFSSRKLTLAVAESCTAGLVSHYLTSLPGASLFFSGGLITYATELKRELLGLPDETIARFGIVSREAAHEMAERARALCGADWAVATTGNLGPGVVEGKERGLVYVAAAAAEETVSRELRLAGSRDENKHAAAFSALKLLAETAEAVP